MCKMAALKRPKIGFQDQLSLNAGQKYCRMVQGGHSAILLTFIKLPLAIKILFCLFLTGHFTQVLLYSLVNLQLDTEPFTSPCLVYSYVVLDIALCLIEMHASLNWSQNCFTQTDFTVIPFRPNHSVHDVKMAG